MGIRITSLEELLVGDELFFSWAMRKITTLFPAPTTTIITHHLSKGFKASESESWKMKIQMLCQCLGAWIQAISMFITLYHLGTILAASKPIITHPGRLDRKFINLNKSSWLRAPVSIRLKVRMYSMPFLHGNDDDI